MPFPVLHIQRVHSGIYGWQISLGGHVLAQDDGLASIAECLKQALHDFSEETHAVEIRNYVATAQSFLDGGFGVVASECFAPYCLTISIKPGWAAKPSICHGWYSVQ